MEGTDIWKQSADQLADFRLEQNWVRFQDYHLFPRLTTAETLRIPLILERKNSEEAIHEAEQKVPRYRWIEESRPIAAVKLSGGNSSAWPLPGPSSVGRMFDYGSKRDRLAGRRIRERHLKFRTQEHPEQRSLHSHVSTTTGFSIRDADLEYGRWPPRTVERRASMKRKLFSPFQRSESWAGDAMAIVSSIPTPAHPRPLIQRKIVLERHLRRRHRRERPDQRRTSTFTRKLVGTVKEILVSEGQRVESGRAPAST